MNIRRIAIPFLVALFCISAWTVAQANELIYLPIVANGTSGGGTIPQPPTATPTATPTPQVPTLAFEEVAGGLTQPVYVTHAGDGSGRLFVVEQPGRIRVVKSGALLPTSFLDITDRVTCCAERGLLSVAFPPGSGPKSHFYVNYTATVDEKLETRISRFQITGDPDVADVSSEEILLTFAQPLTNHNGGLIKFGPDGYLYIGTGDGGGGGDPLNNGQKLDTLLGKMLRIDTESDPGEASYLVPASNPFVGEDGVRSEIWAYGLRNPWRFSFDRLSGDLWIADVGQNAWEEVNYQPASSTGGENYGWRITEATHCYNPDPCDTSGLTLPVTEYSHDQGDRSITGGYVIRSPDFPNSQGVYLYADFVSGRIWGLRQNNAGWQSTELLDTPYNIASFGEDETGRLYLTEFGGTVQRIVPGQ